jgi:hypothetical protein
MYGFVKNRTQVRVPAELLRQRSNVILDSQYMLARVRVARFRQRGQGKDHHIHGSTHRVGVGRLAAVR